MTNVLRAMATAPRDGSFIIAVYPDFTGVEVITHRRDFGWYGLDGQWIDDEMAGAGWLEIPADVQALFAAAGEASRTKGVKSDET